MSWWLTYFDELYLRMFQAMAPPDQTLQEVAGTVSFLDLAPGAHILDLACGQGRHALPLARLGYRLAGLDRSAFLVQRAKEAAVEAGHPVQWAQGDMRSLPWGEQFDACVSLFTAFGYFEEEEQNQQVLEEVRRVLKPGGLFLLDVPNRDYYLLRILPYTWRRYGEAIVLEETTFDPITCRFATSFTWVEEGRTETLRHSVRHYTAPELKGMLHCAGLVPTALYGDFDGRPFDLDSKRLIVVAEKPSS